MATNVNCPQCGTEIEISKILAEEYKTELRNQMKQFKNEQQQLLQKEKEEHARQQHELQKLIDNERRQSRDNLAQAKRALEEEFTQREKAQQEQLKENMRKSIHNDYAAQLAHAQQQQHELQERQEAFNKKELEYLRQAEELKAKEKQRELDFQKQIIEERSRLEEQLKKQQEQEQHTMLTQLKNENQQLKIQFEQQKKLAEEMKRKAEQGSMQLQGEAQELILEETLRSHFVFDLIEEVGKGVRGADCVQTVRNNFGAECGKIIYESKRTANFSAEWIEKLKKDMRTMGIDMAVIVTQAMPKDKKQFCNIDGVWVCSFYEVLPLAAVLREGILKVHHANRNNENKGEKMAMLYDYLVSAEFKQQWKAVAEGFIEMKKSIITERTQMEKLWKTREKQLDKVLLNAVGIQGSIEGIAGRETIQLDFGTEEQMLIE